jgi:hypothetical protein
LLSPRTRVDCDRRARPTALFDEISSADVPNCALKHADSAATRIKLFILLLMLLWIE